MDCGDKAMWGPQGADVGCSPPFPPHGLTQQGDTEKRQEHEGARGGPPGKEHGQEPQEPAQEQPVQPGTSPATEGDAGVAVSSGVPPQLPSATPRPVPLRPHRPRAPAPPVPMLLLPPAIGAPSGPDRPGQTRPRGRLT